MFPWNILSALIMSLLTDISGINQALLFHIMLISPPFMPIFILLNLCL